MTLNIIIRCKHYVKNSHFVVLTSKNIFVAFFLLFKGKLIFISIVGRNKFENHGSKNFSNSKYFNSFH